MYVKFLIFKIVPNARNSLIYNKNIERGYIRGEGEAEE